jgi:hypothetical protein
VTVYDEISGTEAARRMEEFGEILLCPSCAQKAISLALFNCQGCGASKFLDVEILKEGVLEENPSRPEISSWFEKLPLILIGNQCSKCAGPEAQMNLQFIDIQIREGTVINFSRDRSKFIQ